MAASNVASSGTDDWPRVASRPAERTLDELVGRDARAVAYPSRLGKRPAERWMDSSIDQTNTRASKHVKMDKVIDDIDKLVEKQLQGRPDLLLPMIQSSDVSDSESDPDASDAERKTDGKTDDGKTNVRDDGQHADHTFNQRFRHALGRVFYMDDNEVTVLIGDLDNLDFLMRPVVFEDKEAALEYVVGNVHFSLPKRWHNAYQYLSEPADNTGPIDVMMQYLFGSRDPQFGQKWVRDADIKLWINEYRTKIRETFVTADRFLSYVCKMLFLRSDHVRDRYRDLVQSSVFAAAPTTSTKATAAAPQ